MVPLPNISPGGLRPSRLLARLAAAELLSKPMGTNALMRKTMAFNKVASSQAKAAKTSSMLLQKGQRPKTVTIQKLSTAAQQQTPKAPAAAPSAAADAKDLRLATLPKKIMPCKSLSSGLLVSSGSSSLSTKFTGASQEELLLASRSETYGLPW